MLRMELSDSHGARIVSGGSYGRGELIHRISRYRVLDRPTYQTVQVGPDEHIDDFGVLIYLNHSCRPTTRIDTSRLLLLAEMDIAAGDELTFFYPSTEWEMDRPFVCLCGARECAGYIAGARHFPRERLHRYFLNPHIRTLLARHTARPRRARVPLPRPAHPAAARERVREDAHPQRWPALVPATPPLGTARAS